MKQMRLRHNTEMSGPCGVEIQQAGTIVNIKANDTDPEYVMVEVDGCECRIHQDELDPLDEPYGDSL